MASLAFLGRFFGDLRAQRLRSALTILGITWGTVAVVVLLSFGAGLEYQTKKNMAGLGDGIVIVFGGRTTKPFAGFPEGRPVRPREEDVAMLAREIPEIGAISPEYGGRNVPMRRGAEVATPYITGTDPAYGAMRNIEPEPGGRFLNPVDLTQRRRVVVLGNEIKDRLFGEEDAVGRQVLLGEVPFTVIGVMQPKNQNSSYGARDSDRIFIPASTYRVLFNATRLNNFIYVPARPELGERAKQRMYEVLAARYRFDPADRDALGVWDTAEFTAIIRYVMLGLNIFLGVVGSFTLTVGGIGVANIMYIVVRERTPEIGIKRSVGARRRDILLQFLGETFLIVAVGAALGLLVATGIVQLLGLLPFEEELGRPTMNPTVLGATAALLAFIAILAGWFPARRASRLEPIECLRQTGV